MRSGDYHSNQQPTDQTATRGVEGMMKRNGLIYEGDTSWRCQNCDRLHEVSDGSLPRCDCRKLSAFHKGQTVQLAETVRHPSFRGLVGTVKRTVKSRNVVTVEVKQNGFYITYDAVPTNVIPLRER